MVNSGSDKGGDPGSNAWIQELRTEIATLKTEIAQMATANTELRSDFEQLAQAQMLLKRDFEVLAEAHSTLKCDFAKLAEASSFQHVFDNRMGQLAAVLEPLRTLQQTRSGLDDDKAAALANIHATLENPDDWLRKKIASSTNSENRTK